MPKIIVSNTGPIISLEKIKDGFEFIRKLYNKILIPPAVLNELSSENFASPADYLINFKVEDLLEVKPVMQGIDVAGFERLDEGEKQSISLAVELNLPLLIEETLGRKIALSTGLQISGIAGQIIKAYRTNVIPKTESIYKLKELFQSGRISSKMFDELIDSLDK